MLVDRSGRFPSVPASAGIAGSAQLVGDVRVGEGCVIDHGAVLVSSGPPVALGAGSVVMPNPVIRSAGGAQRPAFKTTIGHHKITATHDILEPPPVQPLSPKRKPGAHAVATDRAAAEHCPGTSPLVNEKSLFCSHLTNWPDTIAA
jgi:hypothetical protein